MSAETSRSRSREAVETHHPEEILAGRPGPSPYLFIALPPRNLGLPNGESECPNGSPYARWPSAIVAKAGTSIAVY